MKNYLKGALIFAGGALVGSGCCAVKATKFALSNEKVREFIVKQLTDKITESAVIDQPATYVSYHTKDYQPKQKKSYNYAWVFDTRANAEQVLGYMQDIIDIYGFVTLADFYDLIGDSRHTDYTYNKRGWTSLDNVSIERTRYGYEMKLPKTVPIN